MQFEELPEVGVLVGKDVDGDPPNQAFNYASVIGTLQHLYGHSRFELRFAASQVSRFSLHWHGPFHTQVR